MGDDRVIFRRESVVKCPRCLENFELIGSLEEKTDLMCPHCNCHQVRTSKGWVQEEEVAREIREGIYHFGG